VKSDACGVAHEEGATTEKTKTIYTNVKNLEGNMIACAYFNQEHITWDKITGHVEEKQCKAKKRSASAPLEHGMKAYADAKLSDEQVKQLENDYVHICAKTKVAFILLFRFLHFPQSCLQSSSRIF
jgi:hypothetical protein